MADNAFVRIDLQNVVTLVMPMVEMGQGIYTSLAMLLAEELEVGLDQVKLEHAPPNDALYANAILHRQLTGMSSSIRAFWTPLRQAGAVARTLLIAAAAKQWRVDPAVCRAKHGVVSAGSRQLSRLVATTLSIGATQAGDKGHVTLKLHSAMPDNLIQVILHGIAKPAFSDLGYMPAFKDSMSDAQVAELVSYLRRQFAPDKPEWQDVAGAVSRIRGTH